MFVKNVENFLEKHIEGFFNTKFSSYVQAVEIFKRLEKEMYFKKKTVDKKTYVPNDYLIFLSEDDYENLYSDDLCDQISAQIIGCANKNGYTIRGSLLVRCRCDRKLKKGCFCIETEFDHDEERAAGEMAQEEGDACSSETIVFDRDILHAKEEAAKRDVQFAALTVISGRDSGESVKLGMKRVNIGRRTSNEFMLSDANASRLHAYIVCREYKHVLCDAGSLNGTYVNGQKITERTLENGDEIKIGSTVLLYEVTEIAD